MEYSWPTLVFHVEQLYGPNHPKLTNRAAMSDIERKVAPIVARMADLMEVVAASENLLVNKLTGQTSDQGLYRSFRIYLHGANLLHVRLLQKYLEESPSADLHITNSSAEIISTSAMMELFFNHHPALVREFYKHQEPHPDDVTDAVLKLQHLIPADNPSCERCEGRSRVVAVERDRIIYSCVDELKKGCRHYFTQARNEVDT